MLLRPQATRMLGAAHLAAGRVEEGASLVRAAADEVESGRLLMQQAAVLAMLAEACFAAGRMDDAAKAAHRALSLARERGQRGDEAAALRVLGDVDNAEHYYLAAIALARELEMRPLLARSHLGIARLYLRTGERERAGPHLDIALQLFAANDMPVWLRQAKASLGERARGRGFAGG
jgi:tetratricopeptide (TPR) repeat protein